MKKFTLRFLLIPFMFAFIALQVDAQVQVFASTNVSDSADIKKAYRDLDTELRKAGFYLNNISDPSLFKGKGILLLHEKDASKYKIKFPDGLKKFAAEGIYIKGNEQSTVIIGNSGLAIQEAIYIYLEQLGFRYYLPGDEWTIVPKLTTVYKNFQQLLQPDFSMRTIANGHGFLNLDKPKADWDKWYKANRLGGASFVFLGHNYAGITSTMPEEFKKHPEYFAGNVPKGTIPVDPKFNVANKDLVKLVVKIAEENIKWQVSQGYKEPFFSMEPSDGGGFCNSPECLAIGNSSEQVFYLANEVAKAIKKYPNAFVGTYAYNEHIVPPKRKLERNFLVIVTNGFNRSKYGTEELLKMWKERVNKVGVYEYLSVFEGNMDMPGKHYASNTKYLVNSVRNFYKAGAKAYNGESTMGWINRGPGQYLLTKLFWNVNVNADSIKNDFYKKSFEDAEIPMRKLFESWESYPHWAIFPHDMANWHALIEEAYSKTRSETVRKRIDQVKIYLHYVVMYTELQANKTEANIQRILNYAWRTKELALFSTVPVMVSMPNYNGFPQFGFYANPLQEWKKNGNPVTNSEIQQNFRQDADKYKGSKGVTSLAKADVFTDLKSVSSIPSAIYRTSPHSFWGNTKYIIRINKKSADNYFLMASGHAANPPVDLDVIVHVAPMKEGSKNLLEFGQRKKIENEKFSLASLEPGYYRVSVYDQQKMFVLQFSNSIDYCIIMEPGNVIQTTSAAGLNEFYFYVPKGTKRFAVSKSVVMTLESPKKRLLNYENNLAETFYVDVLPGEEGIWSIHNQAGWFFIDGIPPYLGSHPSRMLVPAYLKK